MTISANETLLHYEELGGIDLKIRITLAVVTSYVSWYTGLGETAARKHAIAMRDSSRGWAEILDDDERFYEWAKVRFKYLAARQGSHRETYAVVTYADHKVSVKEFHRNGDMRRAFAAAVDKGYIVAVFFRKYNGPYYTNPMLKKRATEDDIEIFHRALDLRDPDITLRGKCRSERHVPSCEMCLRHKIQGPKGCPFEKGEQTND